MIINKKCTILKDSFLLIWHLTWKQHFCGQYCAYFTWRQEVIIKLKDQAFEL